MPSKSELKQAYKHNPDGCGFASPSLAYKSLSFGAFWHQLKRVPQDQPCIIHFRWATHGAVTTDNCHPFYGGGVWFAHNGVINIRPYVGLTDSETAFRRYLLPAILDHGFDSKEFMVTVRSLIGGSKFAFLEGNEVHTYGPFIEYRGCLYSNLHHHYRYF